MTRVRPGVHAAEAVRVHPVPVAVEVAPGDDLCALLVEAIEHAGLRLEAHDVVVVTHKVVSKAEGACVHLGEVVPSDRAAELAAAIGGDPRLLEVVLRESSRVVRAERGVVICETRHGLVCANAGVDRSNAGARDAVTLLPRDPDASAARLRRGLADGVDGPLGVVLTDTFGRPFRLGGVNVAIGTAGLPALTDHSAATDGGGYELRGSVIATADEIAAAAELVMGKLERVPAAIVRGLRWAGEGRGAAELLRDPSEDIFRR